MNRLGLFFAGGAFIGAAFEAAASMAINDYISNDSVQNSSYFGGISSGSIVSTFLAGGASPKTIAKHLVENPLIIGSPASSIASSVDVKKIIVNTLKTPKSAGSRLLNYITNKFKKEKTNSIDFLEGIINAIFNEGLFSIKGLENFMKQQLKQMRIFRFEDINSILAIAALNVNTGKRAVFGKKILESLISKDDSEYYNSTIPQAVAASCAVPLLFLPFEYDNSIFIDGALCDTCLLDIGLKLDNVELGIVFNPLEPINDFSLKQHGPIALIEQSYRLTIYSRIKKEFALAEKTDKDLIYMAPSRSRNKLVNPFRYEKVKWAIIEFYLDTAQQIIEKDVVYSKKFEKIGLKTTRNILSEKTTEISKKGSLNEKIKVLLY